jgi:hypothetical protein
MSFSRYKKVKKQVSTDRGVTWQDTEPLEYCDPMLEGVFATLDQCEDVDCKLEEYRYELVDGDLPTNICGSGTSVEFGIAKQITFTEGGIVCGQGQSQIDWDLVHYDMYPSEDPTMLMGHLAPGHLVVTRPAYIEYYTHVIDGAKIVNLFEYNCCTCCDMSTCFRIDEFMPWVGQTIKRIVKTHWTREHCSDEWVKDLEYGDVDMGFGERWYPSWDVANNCKKWQHQVMESVDDEGNIAWANEGTPFSEDIIMPSGASLLPYISGGAYLFNNTTSRLFIDATLLQYSDEVLCGHWETDTWVDDSETIANTEYDSIDDQSSLYRNHTIGICNTGSTFTIGGGNSTTEPPRQTKNIGEWASVGTYRLGNSSAIQYRNNNGCIGGYCRYRKTVAYGNYRDIISTMSHAKIRCAAVSTTTSQFGDKYQYVLVPMLLNGEEVLVDVKNRLYWRPFGVGRQTNFDGKVAIPF